MLLTRFSEQLPKISAKVKYQVYQGKQDLGEGQKFESGNA